MVGSDRQQLKWVEGNLGEADSLFVSDELRGAVEEILASEELNAPGLVGSFKFIVSSSTTSLAFDLTRLEQSAGELLITGLANRSSACDVISLDPTSWESIDILQRDSILRTHSLDGRTVRTSLEIPQGSDSCLFTIVCTDPRRVETKAELELNLSR